MNELNELAKREWQTLADVRAAYDSDRAAVDAAHPPITDPATCRYCHSHWYNWARLLSRFDGHVQCIVTKEFRKALVRFMKRNHKLSYTLVGSALGVSRANVRAWWLAESALEEAQR